MSVDKGVASTESRPIMRTAGTDNPDRTPVGLFATGATSGASESLRGNASRFPDSFQYPRPFRASAWQFKIQPQYLK